MPPKKLLTLCGYTAADVGTAAIDQLPQRLKVGEEKAAAACGVGVPTLRDVAAELCKPGRDPPRRAARPPFCAPTCWK